MTTNEEVPPYNLLATDGFSGRGSRRVLICTVIISTALLLSRDLTSLEHNISFSFSRKKNGGTDQQLKFITGLMELLRNVV